MKARIFNIQKYSIYDGPGIRTIVFFSGCPLRCLWCSNPEGQTMERKILFSQTICTSCGRCTTVCPEGLHTMDGTPPVHHFAPEGCTLCAACVRACLSQALTISGQDMEMDDIVNAVLEDSLFYETSGGGVTVSGGEPLVQWQAVATLLERCRMEGLNTAMETTGHAPREHLARVAPLVNLFLYDIKAMDDTEHRRLTGVGNTLLLDNLTWLLEQGRRVRLRMPLISGCNASMEEMHRRAAFLAPWQNSPLIQGIDLLPYHKLGVGKYAQLGRDYTLDAGASVSSDFLEEARQLFCARGFDTTIVRH